MPRKALWVSTGPKIGDFQKGAGSGAGTGAARNGGAGQSAGTGAGRRGLVGTQRPTSTPISVSTCASTPASAFLEILFFWNSLFVFFFFPCGDFLVFGGVISLEVARISNQNFVFEIFP